MASSDGAKTVSYLEYFCNASVTFGYCRVTLKNLDKMVSTINEMKWSLFKRSLFFRSYLDSSGVVFNTLYMVLFSDKSPRARRSFASLGVFLFLLGAVFDCTRCASLLEKRMPDGFLVPPVLEYEPYSLASDEERKKAEHERSANANGTRLRAYLFSFEECSYFLYLLKIHDRQFLCLYLKKYDHQEKKRKKKKKKTQNTPRDDDDDARTEHEKNDHRRARRGSRRRRRRDRRRRFVKLKKTNELDVATGIGIEKLRTKNKSVVGVSTKKVSLPPHYPSEYKPGAAVVGGVSCDEFSDEIFDHG